MISHGRSQPSAADLAMVRKINAAFAEKNLYMLNSPVSGGPGGAASGKMAIWAGGDEQIFNRHKPVLDAMGDQAAYIGPIGAGTIAKLVHNCTSAVMGVALAEVFTMGIKAGVEPLDLWEAVRQGATGRQRTFDRLGRFLSGQHDPADFALRLLHKDVGLAVGLGREVGVPMRLANMAFEELTEAMNRGWGTRNSSVGNSCRSSAPASSRPPSIPSRCKRSSTPISRISHDRQSTVCTGGRNFTRPPRLGEIPVYLAVNQATCIILEGVGRGVGRGPRATLETSPAADWHRNRLLPCAGRSRWGSFPAASADLYQAGHWPSRKMVQRGQRMSVTSRCNAHDGAGRRRPHDYHRVRTSSNRLTEFHAPPLASMAPVTRLRTNSRNSLEGGGMTASGTRAASPYILSIVRAR